LCVGLTAITVATNNPNYESEGGILYDKAKTTLIKAPPAGISGNVSIPANVTSIGEYAFAYCDNITSVTFATDSQLSIGYRAFINCYNLNSIIIPENVTSIGGGAFASCTSLTSVTIPSSITSIEPMVFSLCTSLSNITVDANNPNYSSEGGILYDKAKTTLITYPTAKNDITIPASVTSIGGWAFAYCHELTGITIPNSVTSIGWSAFSSTMLASITIPESVTYIDNYAFSGCTALSSVTFLTGSNISDVNFKYGAFPEGNNGNGDNLRSAYLTGGAGTYIRGLDEAIWTKQP